MTSCPRRWASRGEGKLGSLSELENVSKDALADDSGHEGLIVAMAGAIHAVPEQSDLE